MSTPAFKNQRLLIDRILCDDNLNSRSYSDSNEKEIEKLSQSIYTTGLIHPPTVIAIPNDTHESNAWLRWFKFSKSEKLLDQHKFLLVAGFRRFHALRDFLKWEAADFRVLQEGDLADALIVNATENFARKNLSRYETAKQFWELNHIHGVPYADIAKRIRGDIASTAGEPEMGLSLSNVSAWSRIYERCTEPIKAAWKAGHPRATFLNLTNVCVFKTEQEQLEQWAIICGDVLPDEFAEHRGGPKRHRSQRSKADLIAAITKVSKTDRSVEWKHGALDALNYALGRTERLWKE